jgi:hypothetical protein
VGGIGREQKSTRERVCFRLLDGLIIKVFNEEWEFRKEPKIFGRGSRRVFTKRKTKKFCQHFQLFCTEKKR